MPKLDTVIQEEQALEKRLLEARQKRKELEEQLEQERIQAVGAAILAEFSAGGGLVTPDFLMPILDKHLRTKKQRKAFPELEAYMAAANSPIATDETLMVDPDAAESPGETEPGASQFFRGETGLESS